jgi:hypothetical protein
MMNEVNLTLAADPPRPQAGTAFNIRATLVDGPAVDDLEISFEKHRFHVDDSGGHDICVIEAGYFADGGGPKPIELKAGDREGSVTVNVSAMAKNPLCPKPRGGRSQMVVFPDYLLLTAFVRRKSSPDKVIGEEHIALTITGAQSHRVG